MPLTHSERLNLIRARAKQKLPLLPQAAAQLDEIKTADPDLGEPQAFGQTLAPDNVRKAKPERTQDEENEHTEEISPAMRAALG
jgi:hypothetical protein